MQITVLYLYLLFRILSEFSLDYPVLSSGHSHLIIQTSVGSGVHESTRGVSRGVNKGNVRHGKHLAFELGNVVWLSPVQHLQHIVFLSFPTSLGVTGGICLCTASG